MSSASPLDPRFTLARPDLAEQALEGLIAAEVYRAARTMHGAAAVADLHSAPGGERIDQLLHGEIFSVLDQADGWAWGQATRDGVVGWVRLGVLADGAPLASHRVSEIGGDLPLNALTVEGGVGRAEIGQLESDPVLVAERLIGAPHALGARSSFATDCSGLVQQALMACGRAAPRWSDGQAELGEPVSFDDRRRGDLIVWLRPAPGDGAWTGHSALALDDHRVIHASGHHGKVVVEALAAADARCRADGLNPPLVRRI